MNKRKLFRQEAIDNLKTRWLGQALLTGNYPTWIVIFSTFIFSAIFLIVVIFCTYTRRVNVYGEVTSIPRAINVFSSGKGFISHNWKKVGDNVAKGDYIYKIDVSKVTTSGNVSENIIQATQEQKHLIEGIIRKLDENKSTTLTYMREQLLQYEQAYKDAKISVDQARKGMEEMKVTMQNYVGYKQRGLINNDQMTNQRYLYYQQQSVYQNLNSQVIQQSLQITSLKGDIITKEVDFDNQISQHRYELSELQRRLADMDATGTILISSPIDGRIESLSVTLGQMINSGDSLAQIMPVNRKGYFLVLWLPNDSIPYVSTGDKINIRYDAYPYEKFGQFSGEILSISSVPVSSQELNSYSNAPRAPQSGTAEPFYKITVDISKNNRSESLKLTTGMKARATVFMEKRPLYQWIFSPYYKTYNSLMGPIND
jgi:membrane fusion protein